MRLTINNIRFVKELTFHGVTYAWYVSMKSNRVSDGRMYSKNNEFGYIDAHTVYPLEQLPKTVQKYIEHSQREVFIEVEDSIHYIYR